jgi:hypothetical protein
MAINFTTFEGTLQTKLDAVTDPKEMLLLGKAVESTVANITISDIQTEGTTQVGLVQTEGATQVSNVQAASSGLAALTGAAFTGGISGTTATFSGDLAAANVTVGGNLTVNGTTTTVNSTTLDVADKNITVASGAADAATANGSGLTVDGANATIIYTSATDTWDFNKAVSGTYTNLHPELTTTSAATTQTIDMDQPMHHTTMTAATAFSGVNLAAGKTAMMVLDTSATPHTPTWNADIKWPDATEPTWADYRYWIVSMTCLDGVTILASASGYTV